MLSLSKKIGKDQELIQANPTSHPGNQKSKKHTCIDKPWTTFSQAGGHLATVNEVKLEQHLFYLVSKTKQEAEWAAVMQLTIMTILLEIKYTRT